MEFHIPRRAAHRLQRAPLVLLWGLSITGALVACSGTGKTDTTSGRDTADTAGPAQLGECSPALGLTAALPACTAQAPCTDTADGVAITEPTEVPQCAATAADRTAWDDGGPVTRTGADGVTRYTCESYPQSPAPLVLWFHGASGSADDLYNATSLRDKATTFDLAGDGGAGFGLVSIQGRNLSWPTADPRDTSHHDIYFRDLGSPSSNPDVQLADAIIDELVASGAADPARIYAMGWSNGGFFAQLYGIARHSTATPGGNRVAAVAVFTAADPFNDTRADDDLQCQLDPYPQSELPIFLVTRSCDLIACDQDQADAFLEEGYILAPGAVVEPWVSVLQDEVGADVTWRLVDGYGERDDTCTSPAWCPVWAATLNHIHWPDGVSDGSGNDYELEMLEFLRDHPL